LNNPLIWQRHYILAAGDWDICLGDTLRLAGLFDQNSIPHTTDIWGGHQKHDWPLWHRMARKFFG
jgi:esterase/lipase superfamily enzyme